MEITSFGKETKLDVNFLLNMKKYFGNNENHNAKIDTIFCTDFKNDYWYLACKVKV